MAAVPLDYTPVSSVAKLIDALAELAMATGRFTPRESEQLARQAVETVCAAGWRKR